MFKNYLLIAYRNLLKNKVFSLINILGVAIGMASCMLILQYVGFELSYDDFHTKADQIYRVSYKYQNQNNTYQSAVNVPALGPGMMTEFPEVVSYARLYPFASYQFSCAMQYREVEPAVTFNESKLYYADATFLTLFSFPLVQGSAETVLREPNSVVISEKIARKYFGDVDPMGKTLTLISSSAQEDFSVTGVIKNIPQNSHFAIDILLSWGSLPDEVGTTNWKDAIAYTYLQLAPSVAPESIEAKLAAFLATHDGASEVEVSMDLQPLADIYLHSKLEEEMKVGGNPAVITLLILVALVILMIAWINYTNLTTSRALERAKEVGVRKVTGASRWQLLSQFLTESTLMNACSLLVALTLVQFSWRYFSQLSGIPGNEGGWINPPAVSWWVVLVFLVAGVFISGFYPAWLLSSFRPVSVLKGSLGNRIQGVFFRKALVVLQFIVSIVLITGVSTLYQQYNFIQKQDLGIDVDQTLVVKTPSNTDSLYLNRLTGFKEKLRQYTWVDHITTSSEVPGRVVDWTFEVRKNGNAPPRNLPVQVIGTDFLETYGLRLLAGRNFFPSEQPAARFGDKTETVILNEEAIKQLEFDDPEEAIGRTIYANGNACTIVGVVNNFHQSSLKNPLQPFIFLVNDRDSIYYSIKLNPDQTVAQSQQSMLAMIRSEWDIFFPDNPFDYFYLDHFYQQQYQADIRLGKLFSGFSVVAVVIACLGLFGLLMFMITRRTKEIGIRKVLGASVAEVLQLLTQNFLKLIALSALLAMPLAYWGATYWLEQYAFRVSLGGWFFFFPIALITLIVLVTISFQTVRAALANPAESLRNE
uniref:ABC transporter permease n=1 Tax=Roseihalotalea indica TaxID=2867963 RepID=A0AA49JGM1_9BACT|nr:ABC transporter permease [Tunicatimonas sp. TK19036]